MAMDAVADGKQSRPGSPGNLTSIVEQIVQLQSQVSALSTPVEAAQGTAAIAHHLQAVEEASKLKRLLIGAPDVTGDGQRDRSDFQSRAADSDSDADGSEVFYEVEDELRELSCNSDDEAAHGHISRRQYKLTAVKSVMKLTPHKAHHQGVSEGVYRTLSSQDSAEVNLLRADGILNTVDVEAMKVVYSGLQHLYWHRNDDESWTRSWVFNIAVMWSGLCLVYASFMTYTFCALWDPRIVILMLLPSTFVFMYMLKSMADNVRPFGAEGACIERNLAPEVRKQSCGRLVKMCDHRLLTRTELIGMARVRTSCIAAAVLCGAIGVHNTVWIACTHELVLPDTGDFTLSDDRTKWGGLAGTGFAVTFRAAFDSLAAGCAVLIVLPWLYSYYAVYRLSFSAAEAVVAEIVNADEAKLGSLKREKVVEIGKAVHTLQENILDPLSSGWEFGIASSVAIMLFGAILVIPEVVRRETLYLVVFIFFVVTAATIQAPAAWITTASENVVSALNEIRTDGTGTGSGMVNPETNEIIQGQIDYMRQLNVGRGPGVVILGRVMSKKELALMLGKLATVATIVLPILIKLQEGKLEKDRLDQGSTSVL